LRSVSLGEFCPFFYGEKSNRNSLELTLCELCPFSRSPAQELKSLLSILIDLDSKIHHGVLPKLYIPSTINICKKVLTKAIWADKKWAGFWQISLYIK
jgi:hypothetical protein